MKTKLISPLCLFFLAATAVAVADSARTVVIEANDTLKFSVTRFEAHPGEKLHIVVRNAGSMPKEAMAHNWILLKAGRDPGGYAAAALSAKSEGYEPRSLEDWVLASVPLLGPKESAEVTLAAPTAPGAYEYFCSSPAHMMAGMRGELIVK